MTIGYQITETKNDLKLIRSLNSTSLKKQDFLRGLSTSELYIEELIKKWEKTLKGLTLDIKNPWCFSDITNLKGQITILEKCISELTSLIK